MVLAVVFIDENRFKGYIERQLTDSIGREVAIIGDLDIDPGWISRVKLERLRLANAAWSDHSQMVRTAMLEVGIDIKALLQGEIVISEVIVKSPQILLQIAGDGRRNWNFPGLQAYQSAESRRNAQPEFPAIRRLTITDGTVRYLDKSRDVDVQAKVDRLLANVGRREGIEIQAEGTIRGQPYNLDTKSGSLNALSNPQQSYPVDMNLQLGSLAATVDGAIDRPLKLQGADLKLQFQGRGTETLSALTSTEMPALPAYRLEGRLTGSEKHWQLDDLLASIGDFSVNGSLQEDSWSLSDLQASAADSDLRGSVRVSVGGDRPRLKADLSSQKIDLQQIAALAAAPGPSAADKHENQKRVIDIFRMTDADLDLQAKRILTSDLQLADLDLHLELQDGLLTISPLEFDVYEGHVAGEISLDGRRHPIDGAIDTHFDRLNVEKIIGNYGVSDRPFGRLAGELNLRVTGTSAARSDQRVFLPSIGRLDIKKSRLHYVQAADDTDVTLQIDDEGPARNGQVTRIDGSGRYRGEPFELAFRGDPLLDLREPQDPFALEMSLDIAQTQFRVDGRFVRPLELKGFDIDLAVAGPNPRRLYPLTGIALPDLPPYRISGRLSLADRVWRFQDFEGRVGDSDVSGDIYLDVSGARPFMRFNLVSDQMDFDDLAGLVGAAPSGGAGETVAAENEREARREARTESVLPADPYNRERLRAIDAVVDFKGKRLQAPNLPLDDMQVKFRLDAGRMIFDPLSFGVGGGFVRAKMTMETNEEFFQGSLETEVEKVDLKKVLGAFDMADDSLGIIGGRAKFWVKGNSIGEFAASADGGLYLLMGGGKLDRLLIELAGFDGGEALLELIGEEQQVPIDCAYADLQAENGIVALKTFAVDTSDTLFTVSGTFDLAKETLDLTVQPRPKDVSLFSARSPLRVAGTFNAPEFYPDASSLASRGAVAVGLGLLAGPAALIPLIEPGLGQDSVYCQGLVEAMKKGRRQTRPEDIQ